MPISRPTSNPLFSTDANFASGPEIGLSTRLDPGGAIRAQGVLAESRLAARWENYVLGSHGDWSTYQDQIAMHGALRKWSRAALSTTGAPWSHVIGMQPVRSFDTNGERQRMPFLLGPNGGTRLIVSLSADGTALETPRIINAGQQCNPTAAAACAQGECITIGNVDSIVQYTTNHGSAFTVVSTAFGGSAVHYVAASGVYLYLESHGAFFRGTSLATFASWTGIALGFTATAPAVSEFADDGGNNVVLVSRVNGNGFASIYRSADGGVTWAFVQNFAGFFANVAFSKALGLFFTWDDSGALQSSPTGAVWTAVASGLFTSHGFSAGNKTLACVGPAIVKLFNYTPSGSFTQRGIVYSLDGGLTWSTYAFGEITAGGSDVTQIRAINNRIYAVDALGLWSSGPLEAPLVEL